MTRYQEFTLRYADEDPAFKTGIGGTVDYDMARGETTIHSIDDPRGHVTIEADHFDAFLDALLEIKARRDNREAA